MPTQISSTGSAIDRPSSCHQRSALERACSLGRKIQALCRSLSEKACYCIDCLKFRRSYLVPEDKKPQSVAKERSCPCERQPNVASSNGDYFPTSEDENTKVNTDVFGSQVANKVRLLLCKDGEAIVHAPISADFTLREAHLPKLTSKLLERAKKSSSWREDLKKSFRKNTFVIDGKAYTGKEMYGDEVQFNDLFEKFIGELRNWIKTSFEVPEEKLEQAVGFLVRTQLSPVVANLTSSVREIAQETNNTFYSIYSTNCGCPMELSSKLIDGIQRAVCIARPTETRFLLEQGKFVAAETVTKGKPVEKDGASPDLFGISDYEAIVQCDLGKFLQFNESHWFASKGSEILSVLEVKKWQNSYEILGVGQAKNQESETPAAAVGSWRQSNLVEDIRSIGEKRDAFVEKFGLNDSEKFVEKFLNRLFGSNASSTTVSEEDRNIITNDFLQPLQRKRFNISLLLDYLGHLDDDGWHAACAGLVGSELSNVTAATKKQYCIGKFFRIFKNFELSPQERHQNQKILFTFLIRLIYWKEPVVTRFVDILDRMDSDEDRIQFIYHFSYQQEYYSRYFERLNTINHSDQVFYSAYHRMTPEQRDTLLKHCEDLSERINALSVTNEDKERLGKAAKTLLLITTSILDRVSGEIEIVLSEVSNKKLSIEEALEKLALKHWAEPEINAKSSELETTLPLGTGVKAKKVVSKLLEAERDKIVPFFSFINPQLEASLSKGSTNPLAAAINKQAGVEMVGFERKLDALSLKEDSQRNAFRNAIRTAIDFNDPDLESRVKAISKILDDLKNEAFSTDALSVARTLKRIIEYGAEARAESLQEQMSALRDVDGRNQERKAAIARALSRCSLTDFDAAFNTLHGLIYQIHLTLPKENVFTDRLQHEIVEEKLRTFDKFLAELETPRVSRRIQAPLVHARRNVVSSTEVTTDSSAIISFPSVPELKIERSPELISIRDGAGAVHEIPKWARIESNGGAATVELKGKIVSKFDTLGDALEVFQNDFSRCAYSIKIDDNEVLYGRDETKPDGWPQAKQPQDFLNDLQGGFQAKYGMASNVAQRCAQFIAATLTQALIHNGRDAIIDGAVATGREFEILMRKEPGMTYWIQFEKEGVVVASFSFSEQSLNSDQPVQAFLMRNSELDYLGATLLDQNMARGSANMEGDVIYDFSHLIDAKELGSDSKPAVEVPFIAAYYETELKSALQIRERHQRV